MPTRGQKTKVVQGKIVRVIAAKHFGFIRVEGQSGDFFFHSEDYNGNWQELISLPITHYPKVTGTIVESAKGPRLADITPILEEDASNQTDDRLGRLHPGEGYGTDKFGEN
jgi:cold shock CspA family protein